MEPIRMQPAYQSYVWGGDRIARHFRRALPKGRYAESWEVSDREEGMSKGASGAWQGKTLREILAALGETLLGKGHPSTRFPILMKIIDAEQSLSVQVHPNEESAKTLGGEPKSEMWVALAQSRVYAGLKQGVTQEQLTEALQHGKGIEACLQTIDLATGDAIYIPAGQIHAIAKGAFLLEVQQNSNTTYRLYDWGRIGREIHLQQGLAAIDWKRQEPLLLKASIAQADGHHHLQSLLSCPYFTVERLDIFDRWQIKSHKKTYQILFCEEGEGTLGNERFASGDTFLIPAFAGPIFLQGKGRFITVFSS